MIPVIERYEHSEIWVDGLQFWFFSHEDLGKLIQESPYRRFSNSGNLSGWVIDHPSRQDDIEGGWYDDNYQWGDAF